MSLGMQLNASKSVARAPQLQRPDRPGPFTGEYFYSSGEATYVRCDYDLPIGTMNGQDFVGERAADVDTATLGATVSHTPQRGVPGLVA